MKRSVKRYNVIKSKFYINNPLDYGYEEVKLKSFNDITAAEWWIEDNLDKFIKPEEKENTCLQVIADFDDDKEYVLRSYTL